ncbi:MAG: hypothetical protein CSA68_11105 [Rhodobacterales bacterium]|nr:MAG: hypothetical protein CSA68_11105 [Rhodobacterales bacterium]
MGGGWDAEKLTCEAPTYLRKVKLQGASLWGAQFGGARLSWADFTGAKSLNKARFHGPETGYSAWAWADEQPIGLPEWTKIGLCVYDPEFKSLFKRPDPCIPPTRRSKKGGPGGPPMSCYNICADYLGASAALAIRYSITKARSSSSRPARSNIDGTMPFHCCCV